MRTARTLISLSSLAMLAALSWAAGRATACPNCGPPKPSFAEQFADADVVALARWVSARKSANDDRGGSFDERGEPLPPDFPAGDVPSAGAGSTTYEIVRVARGRSETMRPGAEVEVVRHRVAQKGDLFLLMGKREADWKWEPPVEITEAGFAYLEQAPAIEIPSTQRLEYFLKYLEFPDPLVAADAFQEFANAPYEDMLPLVDRMPRERLRKWIFDEEIVPTRLNLYGMMLGLCGNADDAALMKKKILARSDEMRLEMPGIMSGYLVLTGDKGLELIEEEKLKPKHVEVAQPDGTTKRESAVLFSETYAAVQAVRFMWDYGGGRIRPERLRQSMRIALDRSDLADIAVVDLARWKDWEAQDRVVELYGAEGFDYSTMKRNIIRYLLACEKDVPKEGAPPPRVAKARAHLDALRKRDPQTVEDVERFSFFD